MKVMVTSQISPEIMERAKAVTPGRDLCRQLKTHNQPVTIIETQSAMILTIKPASPALIRHGQAPSRPNRKQSGRNSPAGIVIRCASKMEAREQGASCFSGGHGFGLVPPWQAWLPHRHHSGRMLERRTLPHNRRHCQRFPQMPRRHSGAGNRERSKKTAHASRWYCPKRLLEKPDAHRFDQEW